MFVLVKLYIRKKLNKLRQDTAKSVRSTRLKMAEQELAHYKELPFSRFLLIAIGILVLAIIFLATLFFFFA